MLYEFTLNPDIFDAAILESNPAATAGLHHLFRELAFNGMIANLDKDGWERDVSARLQQLSPALRDKLQSHLKVLRDRHRLPRHPRAQGSPPASPLDWFHLAVREHSRFPLHAALISPSFQVPRMPQSDLPAIVPVDEAFDSPVIDARSGSHHIRQCKEDFHTLLAPVLRYARKVRLIDPYLDCEVRRYQVTLDLITTLLRQVQDGPTRSVEIHTGLPPRHSGNVTSVLDAWEDYLQRRVSPPHDSNIRIHFKVFTWQDAPQGEGLHDRFIITDQCGISTPGGLDCQSNPRSTDWSLLSPEGIDRHIAEYDPATSPFVLLGQRSIS